jgi:predicted Rossmann-fold nucleotide-binding protein
MKQAPFVTGDGQLVEASVIHFNQDLAAPQLFGTMRFSHVSDSLRGLVRDLADRTAPQGRRLDEFLDISGRSGHSRIGLDIHLGEGDPVISDVAKTIELPVVVTALNKHLAESLSDLQTLARRTPVDIGRLFVPMGEHLTRDEVLAAMEREEILLPEHHDISTDGVVEIPLENVRYIISQSLIRIPNNFSEMLIRGKHGLAMFQQPAPSGLPEVLGPKEFLVSALRISLGPYTAFISRQLSHPDVFHLASRLLDGVRTTGIGTPRQAEIYNRGEEPVNCRDLRVRIKLYPADERVAAISSRVLRPGMATAILARGVDFAEITDIFSPVACEALFDEISPAAGRGGIYGRIMMPGRIVNIPWEQEDGRWIPEFQWRLVYECARGNVAEAVLADEEVPKRFRTFLHDLKYVGGEQSLSKVFVCDALPPVDTLRVLKRSGVGVVVIRSINMRAGNGGKPEYYLDQSSYEEIARLWREGMRFFMIFGAEGSAHVREFKGGFWVTAEGKERISRLHTTVAFFGSVVDELKPILMPQLEEFFSALAADERLGQALAVAHGSGPGVMKAVDDAAARHGIYRIGVGIDGEKIGQETNFSPEAVVQFVNIALNTRQDILDRRSLFKVFNIGGYGTCYEINMALTFMKIGHCLPAPYVFVDPMGLGGEGGHLWRKAIEQFQELSSAHDVGSAEIPPLGPMWVVNCCHLVGSYPEALAVIKAFLDDPAAYWKQAGIDLAKVASARDNLARAGVVIPPYIDRALELAMLEG